MILLKPSTAKSAQKNSGAKLRYLPDMVAGYKRVRRGKGYCYLDSAGGRITEAKKLERFRALAIPPAWKNVWISPSKKGHLQATGVDEEGRKQYLYHPEWTKERQRKKIERMLAFGSALQDIRRQIVKDLRHGSLIKEKSIAIALKVTEVTLIRIGNEHYLKKYGSYGLTTLKKRHVTIADSNVTFRFSGKKGVKHEILVRNAALASNMRELKQLTGPYLFQYLNDSGKRQRLRAVDINAYLQRHTDPDFSSKDYRTWFAGLWAFHLLARCVDYGNEKECRANIMSVLDAVSERLGNTRTVCKQYYVPDRLISAYEDGSLLPFLKKCLNGRGVPTIKETERQLLAFLQLVASETNT
ncbi:DNA topoisomerase IB [Parapedobacter deserti]|uniref:DNA topoisomerase n=1 Tax=Parapedobacter deserti TaxID=1912957 RepID=A0ABV7JPZ7_9SPHI